jgi:hypothetical protein
MTTTYLAPHGGVPTLFVDGRPTPPITAYVGPTYVESFRQAGIALYTFTVPGQWWIGPGQYDFAPLDAYLADYVARIPGGYFMPRIYLAPQGYPWWGQRHPDEMSQLRDIATGAVRDELLPNPQAAPYLGHEVRLDKLNLHSFHSLVWRQEAGAAVAALVAHCEAQPYAPQLWAWHFCDGLFQEWFHWDEYTFGGLADYSPAAQADFRAWLRRTYQDDPARLSRAWGRPATFAEATIPSPTEREHPAHDEFYDPVRDRPTVDYIQCFSEATAQSLIALCAAAKRALPTPKVTCVFYGYQFSNMPRPQLNGHYALRQVLDSPAVDMLASPHSYSYRGEGGYHTPQAVSDSIRRAGKLHFDEIDCKTVWTPASVTWKRHISQPQSASATIEMMKKDAAYQLASGTAQWWMDLTNQGWFDAPEATVAIRKLKAIEERLQQQERRSFGEVALVVSQRAMPFQAPREGLHNACLKMFRNWHLSRLGAPFEQIMVDDLARPDLPAYKLYIMANLFYASAEERAMIAHALHRAPATALWIYAPGYLADEGASIEAMQALTGIRFGCADVRDELNVRLTRTDHPLTQGLPAGLEYGTGVERELYQRPPKIQFMPQTVVGPAFYADDPEATVLGLATSTGRAGLVVKEEGALRHIYSAAPLLPWPLLGNIAAAAGVHRYNEQGDFVWANERFLALNAQSAGEHIVRFPRAVDVEDAYEGTPLGQGLRELRLNMALWQTQLLLLSEH